MSTGSTAAPAASTGSAPAAQATPPAPQLTMTNDQQVTLTAAFTDAAGKPAKVNGAPVWAASDNTLAVVKPAADGMSCLVTPPDGAAGTVTISVTADADLHGGAPEPVSAQYTIAVAAAEANAATIAAGQPVAKS